jgi:hypothetical protein
MAVYLFTFHAYRSWNADRPQGYVRKDHAGILPTDLEMAKRYDRNAAEPPVIFEELHRRVIVWIVWDACVKRGWRLHYVVANPSHVHAMVSWTEFVDWKKVSDKLKNLASLYLGRKCGTPGRRWFVHEQSRKRVRDRKHFDYLVNVYLPKHVGLHWKEGDAEPNEPDGHH